MLTRSIAAAGGGVPELEVVPGDDVMDLQRFNQIGLHEIGCRLFREIHVKSLRDHEINAERGYFRGLAPKRAQSERGDIGLEDGTRVRLERQHAPGQSRRGGNGPGFADDGLVSPVHTVEIADGNHRTPMLPKQRFCLSVYAHRVGKCQQVITRSSQ